MNKTENGINYIHFYGKINHLSKDLISIFLIATFFAVLVSLPSYTLP